MRDKFNTYYILEGRTIKACDMEEWAQFFKNSINRIIRQSYFNQMVVSTVFLGIDHSWRFEAPPVLFETMIFSAKPYTPRRNPLGPTTVQAQFPDELANYQRRYTTYKEALTDHFKTLDLLKRKRLYKIEKKRLPRKFKKSLLKRALKSML